jgi:hypothetical protein
MTSKGLFALVAAAAALASCGGQHAALEEHPTAAHARPIALPDPVPAAPAYRVETAEPVDDRRLRQLEKTPGVAVIADVRVARVAVRGPDGTKRLRVASVDSLEFRSVAPTITRDAEFVWTTLLAGRAVVTFDAADALGLGSSGSVRLPGYGSLEVGAFADNGNPNAADVLVDLSVGQAMNMPEPDVLVVGATSGTNLDRLADALKRRLPGARLKPLQQEAPVLARPAPQPVGSAQGSLIGTMTFRVLRNGFIQPDPAWVAANIAFGTVPILGTVHCHRLMLPQVGAALAEIERRGLSHLIDPSDYGGCYVPRFINRDPRRALSMHAFGLAVDINVSSNPEGTRGNMDPRVVAVFEKWGFAWGGRWARPDPMHFELARLLRV